MIPKSLAEPEMDTLRDTVIARKYLCPATHCFCVVSPLRRCTVPVLYAAQMEPNFFGLLVVDVRMTNLSFQQSSNHFRSGMPGSGLYMETG
ncbi:hypothetical protein OESDEN_15120 [Oesophagostomum dentatum]|uniref:Uncharacterized protein n=1 Tax=Oesophagostomum dentatum TaxID=61180 RepID=A0A0B1SIM4_OESDE|nr:hypothetical protein OESDEN_15120 [Oesophagostomum dentatum]